jgi:hypothetical protein
MEMQAIRFACRGREQEVGDHQVVMDGTLVDGRIPPAIADPVDGMAELP